MVGATAVMAGRLLVPGGRVADRRLQGVDHEGVTLTLAERTFGVKGRSERMFATNV
jgi:hypothetical protein